MVPELVGTMLFMVIKPFLVLKLLCVAGLRGTFIVINTWVEIVSAFIYFNVSMFWRFVLWSLSLLTLPARAVAALHREKRLLAQLDDLRDRVDSLSWDRKELQEHIRIANKEHEMMETMLNELEEEHDEAMHRIKLLESELRDLKDENLRLKEVHGKSQWDTDTRVSASYGYGHYQKHGKDGVSPLKFDHYKGGIPFTNILWHKDAFEDEKKRTFDAHEFVKNDGASVMHQIIHGVIDRSVYSGNLLGERRDVALSQSLFSAGLSILVGMIIWEAQDPCMPLVTALFMVVGMSLKSVVQFFSTIRNKPALDAVGLLSLNWFILGTLTYPTLPRAAYLLAPFFTKSFGRALGWFWV